MSSIGALSGLPLVSEPAGQELLRQCHNRLRLPAHYAAVGPDASPDETAAYYMYHHKIILCPKTHSHDWGACPYAHEKENARRRDPSKHKYSSCICPNAKKPEGCLNGVACPHAHTLFEYWLHPQRYRTQLCNSGSSCQRNLCFFAHSTAELRTPGSTHELHIPIPSLVTTADAAGTDSTLVGPPGQHVIEDLSSAPFAVDPGSVHWPVEESSSSFSSQPSRVLSSLAPCVSSSSETSLAVFPSSHIVMGLPGQAAQTALPVTAVFTQQQQELQRRQARFMELQLRLHQQQQQDHMRAAVLQMEVQQQHVLAAAPHPMLVGGHPTAFAGLDQGLEQGVRIFTPGNSLGIHHNFTPNTTAGITSVCPINLALPATAVAVDLINTSPGQCTQPVGGLVGQAVPGSNILPSVNMAATLASLANLSLPSMNLVEPTSGAIPFGGGANMLLISEPLLSAHGGGFVQSCMWKS